MNKGIRAGIGAILMAMTLAIGGCSGGLDELAASSREASTYSRFTKQKGGAYAELEIGGGVFKVTANLNDLSSRELAEKVALVRSAEIAQERGYAYFIVTATRSLAGCVMQGSQFLGGGPVEEWTIKILKEKPDQGGGKIFEVATVLAEVRPEVLSPQFTREEKIANRERNRSACYLTQGLPESEMPYLGR